MTPVHVTVSCPTAAEATEIVHAVVERRLAAAGQTWPVSSTYWWDGEIVRRSETAILFKSTASRVDEIVELIGSLHSYEVPSIAVLPVLTTGPGTEDWLCDSTQATEVPGSRKSIPELV